MASAGNDISEGDIGLQYKMTTKTQVSHDTNVNASVIAASGLQPVSKFIATGLTNNNIHIYDDESLSKIHTLKGHSKAITDIHFSQVQSDILYSSSLDGTVQLWDLRLGSAVREFKDDSHARIKPICSFDINCNESHMCAGSEQIITDAFILFWDLRNPKLLGGYWDSHTDDVTSVTFHEKKPNIVTTGSTDGLINIFDISQTDEDDALQNTFNTESSVDKLKWCTEGERIACSTHNETLQIWDVEQMEMLKSYERQDFVNNLKLLEAASQLLGLDVNTKSHRPTLVLTTNKSDIILAEIGDEPETRAILKNSCQVPLTGALWKMELGLAITADENAWIYMWKK